MTFDEAAEKVKTLRVAPAPAALLQLYAHFKQGANGDVAGDRPGAPDLRGRAKFDAWKALEGLSQDEAQRRYIALVEDLLAREQS